VKGILQEAAAASVSAFLAVLAQSQRHQSLQLQLHVQEMWLGSASQVAQALSRRHQWQRRRLAQVTRPLSMLQKAILLAAASCRFAVPVPRVCCVWAQVAVDEASAHPHDQV
jgi:hypothetical protein